MRIFVLIAPVLSAGMLFINPAGAKAAFKKVEEVCAACHAKFRD